MKDKIFTIVETSEIKGERKEVCAGNFMGIDAANEGDHATRQLAEEEERILQISQVVTAILNEKKPFLQQRYSLKDLSVDTKIHLHHLSAFINKYCGKNFNDFINEYRVAYCKAKILNHEYRQKKLEAIAEESGFNNRNTFSIAFKKVTGVNPSQFLKDVKSGKVLYLPLAEVKDEGDMIIRSNNSPKARCQVHV